MAWADLQEGILEEFTDSARLGAEGNFDSLHAWVSAQDARKRAWAKDNRDKENARMRAWRKDNRDKVNARKRDQRKAKAA